MKENKKIIGKGFENIGQNTQKAEASKEPTTVKLGGHLIDEKLRPRPRDLFSDMETLDGIDQSTRDKVAKAQIENEDISIFLNRTDSSTKRAVTALALLLAEKSQITDPEKRNYYTGNAIAKAKSNTEVPVPAFRCSIYEFAKKFSGKKAPSGTHIKHAIGVLKRLEDQKFFYRYVATFTTKGKKSDPKELVRSGYRPLIYLDDLEIKTVGGDIKKEIVIELNPIFIDQIQTKYILAPRNLIELMIQASPSQNIPSSSQNLMYYFMRSYSSKSYTGKIYIDNLYKTIDQINYENKRKSRLENNLKNGLELCKNMGLLNSWSIETGATGKLMLVYTLNIGFTKSKK